MSVQRPTSNVQQEVRTMTRKNPANFGSHYADKLEVATLRASLESMSKALEESEATENDLRARLAAAGTKIEGLNNKIKRCMEAECKSREELEILVEAGQEADAARDDSLDAESEAAFERVNPASRRSIAESAVRILQVALRRENIHRSVLIHETNGHVFLEIA